MAKDEQKKCAHLSCKCVVTSDEKYCSQLCKEAGADEVEITCDCGHPACAEWLRLAIQGPSISI